MSFDTGGHWILHTVPICGVNICSRDEIYFCIFTFPHSSEVRDADPWILSEEEPYSLFVVVVIFQMARGKLSFNHDYVTRVKLRKGLRCLLYWKVKYPLFNSMNYLAILAKLVNKRKEMPNQSRLAGWKHKGLSWKCLSAVKTELNTHSENRFRPAGLGLCSVSQISQGVG